MKASSFLAGLVVGVVVLTGCGGSSPSGSGSGKTYKIGLAEVLTGASAQTGTGGRQAMLYAIKQINDNGGIDGAKLVPQERDVDTSAAATVSAVQQFTQDNVVAVVGMSQTSAYLAAVPILQSHKILTLGGTASDAADYAHTGNKYGFVFNIPDSVTAQHQARYAVETLHATRIALLLDSTAFGQGYGALVTPLINGAGGTVVSSQNVNPDAIDVSTQISKILAAKPDLIMIALLVAQTTILLYKELEKQAGNSRPALMVAAAVVIQFGYGIPWSVASGTYATYMTQGMYDPAARSKADAGFFAAVQKDNQAPVSDNNANLHDAILAVAAAIHATGGTDPDKLADYLANLQNFSGFNGIKTVSGPYTCAPTHECLFNQFFGQVRGNALVQVLRYTT